VGSRLSTRSQTYVPAENQTWLGSAHGTSEARSITVDGDAAIAIFTDGLVPSGVAVYQLGNGRYAPVVAGQEANARGYLLTTTQVAAGQLTSAALYWHGRVIIANLPAARGTYVGPVAAVRTALPRIQHD
jgi:hypothetical protein